MTMMYIVVFRIFQQHSQTELTEIANFGFDLRLAKSLSISSL